MARALPLLLALVFCTACERKTTTPPTAPGGGNAPAANTPAKVTAPAGVPQKLVDEVAKKWPEIEKAGMEFVQHYEKAQKARAADDRAALNAAVTEATKAYNDAADAWGVIVYDLVEDLPEGASKEKARRYIRPYEKTVGKWKDKMTALSKFTVR